MVIEKSTEIYGPGKSFFFFFFLSISRVSLVSPPVVNAVPDGMGFAVGGGGNGREKRNRAVVNPPFF